jgi:hypothetical protein
LDNTIPASIVVLKKYTFKTGFALLIIDIFGQHHHQNAGL